MTVGVTVKVDLFDKYQQRKGRYLVVHSDSGSINLMLFSIPCELAKVFAVHERVIFRVDFQLT